MHEETFADNRQHRAKVLCVAVLLSSVVSGSPSVNVTHKEDPFASLLEKDVCKDLGRTYEWLVTGQLAQWVNRKVQLNATVLEAGRGDYSALIYVKDNEIYTGSWGSKANHRMIDNHIRFISGIKQKAALPDMVMLINGEDLPQGRELPVFSFCRRPSMSNDLLLPNMEVDWIWNGIDEPRASRAGQNDTRERKIVWYGRPHAWHREHRRAVSAAAAANPDKIHAGLIDWEGFPEWAKSGKEAEWEQYRKPELPQHEWAEKYKYQLNVPGGCASSRLAYQLFTDAAVFLVSSEDEEWYTQLLRPFVHYVPVHSVPETDIRNSSQENILEQVLWAEYHPDEIAAIVAESTHLAQNHLRPGSGRDCYALMLLHAYSRLTDGDFILPKDAQVYD